MPCYRPIDAYVIKGKTDKGKKKIVFQKPTEIKQRIQLPCGQCIGCKLLRSITWATRCLHEIQLHEENCFITLTYNDESIPNDYSLNKSHFQKFIKRLRKNIQPLKIRYFMAGEYGDTTDRPHYHAIIFNYSFPDKIRVQMHEVDNPYYISQQLTRLWTYGNHIIANANFETAAYIARYCTKKITGEKAIHHYSRILSDYNEITGEISTLEEIQLLPEYATMSKKPAIGKEWFKKYKQDCYPSDFLIVDDRKVPIPKYYDKLLEQENKYLYIQQTAARKIKGMLKDRYEKTLDRLAVKENVKKQQLKSLQRDKI